MTQPNQPTNEPIRCHVLSDYQSMYPDPIAIRAGDRLAVEERESEWAGWVWCTAPGGKSGWVPERYVERRGDGAIALCDYDATELTVRAGEMVTATTHEAGWRWCTNARGDSGWVPDEHLSRAA
ncbi:MAG TPA: SH3 domain-containing protein [Anaerolineae bacterium]|nr:SH3 domain-containing protein [Anaerolineae bacterium]